MLLPTCGSSLVSSSAHFFSVSWESALSHFRRSLIECGSPLEVEHSQRLGLLFSKNVGSSTELQRWATLFDAEDVPTTSLMIKALVNHGQWQTAMRLLQYNKDIQTVGALSEVLAQSLMSKQMWAQALHLTQLMLKTRKEIPHDSNSITEATASLCFTSEDDSVQMAKNATFLPEESREMYCGFTAAVAYRFPRNTEWKDALQALDEVYTLADLKTRVKIKEYRVAREVHGSLRYKEILSGRLRDSSYKTSSSLLRSYLHCAVAESDIDAAFELLEILSSFGCEAIPTTCFEKTCLKFISNEGLHSHSSLTRFESLVCKNSCRLISQNVRKIIRVFCADYQLKMPLFANQSLLQFVSSESKKMHTGEISITEMDHLSAVLLSQGKWVEALSLANSIVAGAPQNENERVIVNLLRKNTNCWKTMLQFLEA